MELEHDDPMVVNVFASMGQRENTSIIPHNQ